MKGPLQQASVNHCPPATATSSQGRYNLTIPASAPVVLLTVVAILTQDATVSAAHHNTGCPQHRLMLHPAEDLSTGVAVQAAAP
jgi:hypothetical protein